ncbi:MAG: hypothetical protein KGM16_05465, partial [Bacteroidota bacterium]|nr:hypothetical protein [Bacteroidota bacterium]
ILFSVQPNGFCRAQARKNARSDRVFLDFLFLLHQGKRKGKRQKAKEKTASNPTNSPISYFDNFIKWLTYTPKK